MNLKPFFLILLTAGLIQAKAQVTDRQKQLAETISFTAGGTFGKAKIPQKTKKMGIAEMSVNFLTVITKSRTEREKKRTLFGQSAGKAATATVSSYLNITDGDMTDADYLEIVNHGYRFLLQHLKANGIDTAGWDAVSATDFYKDNGGEKSEQNEEEKSKGNAWMQFNAFNGNTMYGGRDVKFSAFGRLKKVAKMAGDLGADLLFLNLNVDFADIDVDVSVKTAGYVSTWTPGSNSQTTTLKSKTRVAAVMKVPDMASTNGMHGFLVNDDNRLEAININTDLPAEQDYASSMEEDESKAEKKKNKFFSVSLSKKMESTPVVINATKESYKAAAKKALEKYAEALVAKIMVMKNN